MRLPLIVLALAVASAPENGPTSSPAAAGPDLANVIQMHLGVPGLVYVGQPLAEFLAKFPTAMSDPVPGQPEIVKMQVQAEGISCLAMGKTPASMIIESIGFNFGAPYEGVQKGRRRTVEGVGSGSTINDLLGSYGRPSETSTEGPQGWPTRRKSRTDDPNAPVRHHYQSADGTVTTYFVVEGHEVVRMAISRPAEMEKHLSKRPQAGAPQGGP
jgi:hypothetical protein